jgi:hypothetical protein
MVRPGSLWKCHTCGYQFNFQKLTLQKLLGSTISSATLTVMVMVSIVFFLGFVADPILNLYLDPYDTIVGNEDFWSQVDIHSANDSLSGWSLHFMKGLISMGLVGFVKTAVLNPLQWFNFRGTIWTTGRTGGTSTTGRERMANISWLAVIIGISSAFYFFYQWVQTIIGLTLQRIGNNIVDTQLPGDDDDLKPPPGWKAPDPEPVSKVKPASSTNETSTSSTSTVEEMTPELGVPQDPTSCQDKSSSTAMSDDDVATNLQEGNEDGSRSLLSEDQVVGRHWQSESASSSALDSARDQGWSFVNL